MLESCFCLAVATDVGSGMKFQPCTGASFHQRRRLSRNVKIKTLLLVHDGICAFIMASYSNRCIGTGVVLRLHSLQQKVLTEALTDAVSAYPVSNEGRAFILTTVPQVLVLP